MSHYFVMMLRDGLMMPSGFVAESPYRCLIYCMVPEDWVGGEIPESDELWIKGPELKPDKLELLFEALYGKTWRSGNSDGSQYVVGTVSSRLLNPLRADEKPWQYDNPENKQYKYFYYAVSTQGEFKMALPSQL